MNRERQSSRRGRSRRGRPSRHPPRPRARPRARRGRGAGAGHLAESRRGSPLRAWPPRAGGRAGTWPASSSAPPPTARARRAGTRVVGILLEGAWAERVAVPTHALAALPDKVTFSQAATFPVAGLTALHALAKGGLLLGAPRARHRRHRRGGRLRGAARAAGRRPRDGERAARRPGAGAAPAGRPRGHRRRGDPGHAQVRPRRRVGGRAHARHGAGRPRSAPASASPSACPRPPRSPSTRGRSSSAGRTTLYGLYLFTEFGTEPASVGLRRLADLVAAGQLAPHISVERPWTEIAQVAQDLMARRFPGKAVLTLP